MPLIYSKTAKGVAEMRTRAHKLPPRLRSALILVDGKRTDQALRALIAQRPVETVAWLLEHDFIDVVTHGTVPGPPPRPTPPPPPPPPPAPPPFTAAVETRRREALQMLAEHLGPAGDAVVLRIRQAGTLVELRSALSVGAQTLYTFRGRDVAVAFVSRFNDL